MWIAPASKTNPVKITSATNTVNAGGTPNEATAAKPSRVGAWEAWFRTGLALPLTFLLAFNTVVLVPPGGTALAKTPAETTAKTQAKTTSTPKTTTPQKKVQEKKVRAVSTKKKRHMTSRELNFRIVLASYTWPAGAYGDQCKIWAQWVVAKAGGFLPAGYRNEAETRGFGIRKPVEEAVPGDIFQMDKPHTAIVIQNLGDGRLLVRDSNWVAPLKVGEHVLDTRNYLQYNPRVYTVIPD